MCVRTTGQEGVWPVFGELEKRPGLLLGPDHGRLQWKFWPPWSTEQLGKAFGSFSQKWCDHIWVFFKRISFRSEEDLSLNPSPLLQTVCGPWPVTEMDMGPRPEYFGVLDHMLAYEGRKQVSPQPCLPHPVTSEPFLRSPLKRLTGMVCILTLLNLLVLSGLLSAWKGKVHSWYGVKRQSYWIRGKRVGGAE